MAFCALPVDMTMMMIVLGISTIASPPPPNRHRLYYTVYHEMPVFLLFLFIFVPRYMHTAFTFVSNWDSFEKKANLIVLNESYRFSGYYSEEDQRHTFRL